MGIGEILREAREEKNITLDELQETTKIQKRYLQAIEKENFHILPGSFYARAFIKEYAHAVGLNANELLEHHENELPTLGEKRSGAQYTRLQRTRRSSGPSKASAFFSFLPTVIVVLLVIGIVALAIYFYKQTLPGPASDNNEPQETDEFYRKKGGNTQPDNTNEDDANNEEQEDAEEPEEEEVELPEDELILVETGTGQTPESTFDFVHHGEDIVITLEASDKAWLTVNNATESFYHDFISEEVSPLELDISEVDDISLNIGNASFVDVKINDIVLEYPVDRNARVHQKIKINIKQNE